MIPVPPLLSRHYGEAGKEKGGDDHVLPVIPAGRALGEERALTADSGGWGGPEAADWLKSSFSGWPSAGPAPPLA